MMKTLAVVAHPDDEALGCGGLLAHTALEDAVVLLPLRRSDSRGVANWGELLEGFRASCRRLGAYGVVVGDVPEKTGTIEDIIPTIQPYIKEAELVVTHWPGDIHKSHRLVSEAVQVCVRPSKLARRLLFFETISSTSQGARPGFTPNMYFGLTGAEIQRKIEAMSCYPVEAEPARSPDAILAQARVRGYESGQKYAEAYHVGWWYA